MSLVTFWCAVPRVQAAARQGQKQEERLNSQQPTLNLQGKTKSPLLQIHSCPPRQPIPSTAIFQRTSFCCTSSYKFNHQNKKEVPDGASFSDSQAGSQQHKHTEHGQTSALPPLPSPSLLYLFPSFLFLTFPLVAV